MNHIVIVVVKFAVQGLQLFVNLGYLGVPDGWVEYVGNAVSVATKHLVYQAVCLHQFGHFLLVFQQLTCILGLVEI